MNRINIFRSSLLALIIYPFAPVFADSFTTVTVSGNLAVDGNSRLGSNGSDTATINGTANLNNALNVDGATTLGASLSVTGATSLTGNVTLTNSLTVNGNTTLGSGVADTITFNAEFVSHGAHSRLPEQISLTSASATDATIVTRGNGDNRYLKISDFNPAVSAALSGYITTNAANAAFLDQGEGDLRYRTITDSYSKTGADTEFLNQTEGDLRYRTITDSYSKTDADTEFLDQDEADLRYRTITDSYSKTDADAEFLNQTEGDLRYFNNNDAQIVIGSFEVADADAALIVGNGIDANSRKNTLVVKKTGVIEVGDLATPNSAVIRVPQSGDITMDGYQ